MKITETDTHYESVLPRYLKVSLDKMKKALELMEGGKKYLRYDCDYCELQSDINCAEVDGDISPDHAWYLRSKYLGIDKEHIATEQ
ncbi:MAG: hypothetical protein J5964_06215 [Eubacterium sp.]|nr:hypothetical protein [Eubacterium sp.]